MASATRVGVYTRISEDAEGSGLGVARQCQDCEEIARARGWAVHAVYEDNDVSAYQRRVVRPQFTRMLRDLKSGVIDGIVVWDLDRLARRPVDLEAVIDIFDEFAGKRRLVFASAQGRYDISRSDDRAMARIVVTMANKSSADTARRVSRKHREIAEKGRTWGGGYRPFGWKEPNGKLHPKESLLMRGAIEDIISDKRSIGEIRRDWNNAGVRTTAGNPFTSTSLRQTISSPRVAGLRVFQKGVLYDASGSPVRGEWEPIVDVPTWESLCALLDRRKVGPKPTLRKYLLSGIARCGRCAFTMTGGSKGALSGHRYVCNEARGGCSSSIDGEKLDAIVTEAVLRRYAEMTHEDAHGPWDGGAELEAAEEAIKDVQQAVVARAISHQDAFPIIDGYRQRIETLKSERAIWVRQQAGKSGRPVNARVAWEGAAAEPDGGLATRRRLVGDAVEYVAVFPVDGRRAWDASRVDIRWRP